MINQNSQIYFNTQNNLFSDKKVCLKNFGFGGVFLKRNPVYYFQQIVYGIFLFALISAMKNIPKEIK